MSMILRRSAAARVGFAASLLLCSAAIAYSQEGQNNPAPAPAPAPSAAEAPAAQPVDLAAVVATVNGAAITEGDLALAEADLDPQFARLPAEQRRTAGLSAMIEIKLLAAEGEKKNLGDDADFKRRMTFLRERALHGAYVNQVVASAATDAEIRARYDQEIANTPPTNEVRARHILVKTKEEADAIVKQLDDGGDFEAIAKEKSQDPGSGAKGGDLGYFSQGQMVPEFEQAAFALDVGNYSKTPVQTQFGFHVIKVEDKRTKQPPAFDAVKEQVRDLVLREKYFALVKGFRDAATVEIADPALKAAFEKIDKEQQ